MRQTPADGDASSHVSGGVGHPGAPAWASTAASSDAPAPDDLFGGPGATPGKGRGRRGTGKSSGKVDKRGSRAGKRPTEDGAGRGKDDGRPGRPSDGAADVPGSGASGAPAWPLAGAPEVGHDAAPAWPTPTTDDPAPGPTAEPARDGAPGWPGAPADAAFPEGATSDTEAADAGRRGKSRGRGGAKDVRALVAKVDPERVAEAGRRVEKVVGTVRGRPTGVLARRRGLVAAGVVALVVGAGAGAALDAVGGAVQPEAAVVAVTSPEACAAAQVAWSRAAQAQVQMDVTDPTSLRDGFAGAQSALATADAPAAVAGQWRTVADYVDAMVGASEGIEDADLEAAVVGALEGLDTPGMTAASQQVTDYLATDCTG